MRQALCTIEVSQTTKGVRMPSEDRPWVGCHILASLDGRIAGSFMGSAAAAPAVAAYRELQLAYEADALAYGSTTACGFAGSRISCLCSDAPVSEGDYVAPAAGAPYLVSIDPQGEVAWKSGVVSRCGMPDAQVIEVLSSRAPRAYRAYLQEHGVSYLVAGENAIDLPSATEKLERLFGIRRMLVCGGGVTDASFLAAGLLDELSVVVAPVASGEVGVPTLFDQSPIASLSTPTAFAFERAEPLSGGAVHMTYSRASMA